MINLVKKIKEKRFSQSFIFVFIAQLTQFIFLFINGQKVDSINYGQFSLYFSSSYLLASVFTLRLETTFEKLNESECIKRIFMIYCCSIISSSFILFITLFIKIFFLKDFYLSLNLILITILSGLLISIIISTISFLVSLGDNKNAGILRVAQVFFPGLAQFILIENNISRSLIIGYFIGLVFTVVATLIVINKFLNPKLINLRTSKSIDNFPLPKIIFESIKYLFRSIKYLLLIRNKSLGFSIVADFLSKYSALLPLQLIALNYSSAELGGYSFVLKWSSSFGTLLSLPMLDRFRYLSRKELLLTNSFKKSFNSSLISLIILSLVIILPIHILLYFLIGNGFFGSQWASYSWLIFIFSPLILAKFISSTLSYSCYIADKRHIDLIWQIILLLNIILIFNKGMPFPRTITIFSFVYVLLYLVLLLFNRNSSLKRIKIN